MISDIRTDFQRLTAEFKDISQCQPFGPDAYNSIAAMIMHQYYDAVKRIQDELGIDYPENLGVLLFTRIHSEACLHYFQEYEHAEHAPFDELPKGSEFSFTKQLRRGRNQVQRSAGKILRLKRSKAIRVSTMGTSTFPWKLLRQNLAHHNIELFRSSPYRPEAIRLVSNQITLLTAAISNTHEQLSSAMSAIGINPKPFALDRVHAAIDSLMRMPSSDSQHTDLLLTGTLGPLSTRASAMSAIQRGVPVLTIHHGAQYKPFDEPYYDLYEGMLPTAKVVYGSLEAQEGFRLLERERTLNGQSIHLYTRTDDFIRQLSRQSVISDIDTLGGKRILYFSTEFESARYGPYRDVHPHTYRKWQQALIDWLGLQAGRPPMVRLHPKRPTKRYDPEGYIPADGILSEILQNADVLVVDYPTTSLAIAAASNKPVLFFDLDLRRLHPHAMSALKSRCAYARADILNPQQGFEIMESSLTGSFEDRYSPIFTDSGTDSDEVTTVANSVVDAIVRLRNR